VKRQGGLEANLRVGGEKTEGALDGAGVGGSPDVKEVGRRPAAVRAFLGGGGASQDSDQAPPNPSFFTTP